MGVCWDLLSLPTRGGRCVDQELVSAPLASGLREVALEIRSAFPAASSNVYTMVVVDMALLDHQKPPTL